MGLHTARAIIATTVSPRRARRVSRTAPTNPTRNAKWYAFPSLIPRLYPDRLDTGRHRRFRLVLELLGHSHSIFSFLSLYWSTLLRLANCVFAIVSVIGTTRESDDGCCRREKTSSIHPSCETSKFGVLSSHRLRRFVTVKILVEIGTALHR